MHRQQNPRQAASGWTGRIAGVLRKRPDRLVDVRVLPDGHPGYEFPGKTVPGELVHVIHDPAVRPIPTVPIGEIFCSIEGDEDGLEPIAITGGKAGEEDPVCLDHEPLDRSTIHNLHDEWNPKQWLTPVECQACERVFRQKRIEVLQIKREVGWEIPVYTRIDAVCPCYVSCKDPASAVTAAEIAVVGENEVKKDHLDREEYGRRLPRFFPGPYPREGENRDHERYEWGEGRNTHHSLFRCCRLWQDRCL